MPFYSFDSLVPVVAPTAFVHPDAVAVGDVWIGPHCYVGPCAALRGDFGRITLERGSNVQDNCSLHSFPGADCTVSEDGHIGHCAVLHGCNVGRNALIGMNSVIMDEAVIGENAFVGAMSFVKSKCNIPSGVLALGSPARIIRPLTDAEISWKRQATAEYQQLAQMSKQGMKRTAPLSAAEPTRRRLGGTLLPLHQARN